ncbi:amidase family protein [Dactylosporangium sp. CA-233914]|uniref:amidase family protein n=1 Tax=Dactylosporangium sp. CA-233914 TaxID=3239934 RepID=UPI003D917C27
MRHLTFADLMSLSSELGLEIAEADLKDYQNVADDIVATIAALDSPAQDNQAVRALGTSAVREVGDPAERGHDPYNALVRRCLVTGRADGPLSGYRIAIKDNLAIAGVPMTAGSRFMEDYVPVADSTVVARLLEAGADIVAVTNMDALAFSAGGETSDYGTILNPHDLNRTAGGSSGGSAAALWYDGIDATLGTDQGGSVRVPASWCGVLGLKPTHGLVPYYGGMGVDHTFNHVGPMARTAEELRNVLEVIVEGGPHLPPDDATADADRPLAGVRIGLLAEGLTGELADGVADSFHAALARLQEIGAEVREVSVPELRTSGDVTFISFIEGMWDSMTSAGNGMQHLGPYDVDLASALRGALERRPSDLPATVKVTAMVGRHLRQTYHGTLYGKAQNQKRAIRAAFDRQFDACDVLALPTSTFPAFEHRPEAGIAERISRGWSTMDNTSVFNMTGHPALSMPAASVGHLPLGVQLVGPHHADFRLIRIAQAYESVFGWQPAEAGA